MKRFLLGLMIFLGASVSHGALDGPVKPAGQSFALRQGATQLGTFPDQQACETAAEQRTTNPISARRKFEIRSGGGTVLGTVSSQAECLAAVPARLTAEGQTRTTGGNVNSCVVSTNYSAVFQPPTCVATFNFIAKYTGTAVEPEPEPCECPEPDGVLSWIPPTRNTNGSPLTNLAGYRLSYGRSVDALPYTIQIANPAATRYVIGELDSGVWYFSIRAYSTAGTESASSNTVMRTVP